MFDLRDNPEHLMTSLEKFLRLWHVPTSSWSGIDKDKLQETQLPEPLRRFFEFAGEWPSDNWFGSRFVNQDILLPFELLRVEDAKLLFGFESQGVWKCATERDGRDPPV